MCECGPGLKEEGVWLENRKASGIRMSLEPACGVSALHLLTTSLSGSHEKATILLLVSLTYPLC